MTLIDISPTLAPGMPVWPGDTAYEAERTWQIAPGTPVNVSRLTLSTHTGAHADAPLHYDDDGPAIADVALAPYLGPCYVVYAMAPAACVTIDEVADKLPAQLERILFRTYAQAPTRLWDCNFKALDAELIDELARRGARLVGLDTPSIDPETSKTLDAHMAVRRAGMAILEGLILDRAAEGLYELIALPLKLAGMDASPVRAILRSLDES